VLPLTASRYATASFLSIEVRPGRPAAGFYRMREPTPPCAENGIASDRQHRRRGGHGRNGLSHAAVEATEAAATAAPIAGEPVREAAMAAFARSSKRFLAAN
jgi:hypothetical protein